MPKCSPERLSTGLKEEIMALTLSSSAFKQDEVIPLRYSCEGENISPPLTWHGVPEGTRSLVLILDDPDAPRGLFTHWIVYNLPPNLDGLPEDAAANVIHQLSAIHGRNDFGQRTYGGPCPPRGDDPHRYYFRLYALDSPINVMSGAPRPQVLDALRDHVLERAELVGLFERAEV